MRVEPSVDMDEIDRTPPASADSESIIAQLVALLELRNTAVQYVGWSMLPNLMIVPANKFDPLTARAET